MALVRHLDAHTLERVHLFVLSRLPASETELHANYYTLRSSDRPAETCRIMLSNCGSGHRLQIPFMTQLPRCCTALQFQCTLKYDWDLSSSHRLKSFEQAFRQHAELELMRSYEYDYLARDRAMLRSSSRSLMCPVYQMMHAMQCMLNQPTLASSHHKQLQSQLADGSHMISVKLIAVLTDCCKRDSESFEFKYATLIPDTICHYLSLCAYSAPAAICRSIVHYMHRHPEVTKTSSRSMTIQALNRACSRYSFNLQCSCTVVTL